MEYQFIPSSGKSSSASGTVLGRKLSPGLTSLTPTCYNHTFIYLHFLFHRLNILNKFFELAMPYRRNSNNATHKRKTTAVHTGKESKKRAKRTTDVSRPDMAHPQPSSDRTFILDSQPDQTEDQRQKQQVPESISNLSEQHFQSSPAQALLVRNHTPDVQFSTLVFDSAIHSRQPDVLTKFRFESSPTKQQFQSSPAQAQLARIRTPDV